MGAGELRVMTYNIHSCIGSGRCVSPGVTAEAIRTLAPDVVALQEVDEERPETGRLGQTRFLSDALGMRSFLFWPSVTLREGSFGLAVLSRFRMRVLRAGSLAGLSPIGMQPRSAVHVRLETGAGPLHLIDTHLGLLGFERRLQSAQLLGRQWLGAVPAHEPAVLCGDFNAVPFSPTYHRLSSALRDVQRTDARSRRRATFPSQRPLVRIDHIFVNGPIRVRRVEVPRGKVFAQASDHLPVAADLVLGPEPEREAAMA